MSSGFLFVQKPFERMITMLTFILFIIVLAVTWFYCTKPNILKPTPLFTTGSAGLSKPPILADRLIRRITRITSKRVGKYIPGTIGLSAVSRAIKKDYGSILSRAIRKHYAKQYKLPRFVYA